MTSSSSAEFRPLVGWLLGFLTLLAPWAQAADAGPYPKPAAGYVTDLAGLLDEGQEAQLERLFTSAEAETGVEIAILTIYSMSDYPGTNNSSIEAFANGVFDIWGVGNLPADDGVLLVVAQLDRKARIELGRGYGRSRDSDALEIMDEVLVPAFRESRYGQGIVEGGEQLFREFRGGAAASGSSGIGSSGSGGFDPVVVMLLGGLALAAVGVSLLVNGKKGWGWVVLGLAIILVLAAVFLFLLFTLIPSGNGRSSGIGSIGGGGSSGGGGASGSW